VEKTFYSKFVSFWRELFGEKLPPELADGDRMIQAWEGIYKGEPEWKYYSVTGLSGRRTLVRYIVNAPKMICASMAGLIFAEGAEITTDESIEEVLKRENFYTQIMDFTERVLALGTGAIKIYIEDSKIRLNFVTASCMRPVSYSNGIITEADFVSNKVKDTKEYKVVEEYRTRGDVQTIEVKVYRKENDKFVKVPNDVLRLSDGVSEFSISTPLFFVFKNPEVNNFSALSPLGIPLFGNAIDSARLVDETFDYFNNELETSKRKIILPKSCVSVYFDPKTKKTEEYYDKNEMVYVAFDDSEKESMIPKEIAFDLRIDQISGALKVALAMFCKQCGVDEGFLSFDTKSFKTATEVVSENTKTYRTAKNIENELECGILALLETLRALVPLYGGATTADEYSIKFNDNIIQDRDSEAKYLDERYMNGTMSLVDVLMQRDGLDLETAKAKAAEIKAERETVTTGDLWLS